MTGMPHGSGTSDTTGNQALKHMAKMSIVSNIDKALTKACEDVPTRKALKENIIHGTPFNYLDAYCGINQFYEMRRRFFYHLAIYMGLLENE